MAQEGVLPMRNKRSSGDDECAATTADLDDRDQAAVLRETLALSPEVLTLDELVREQTFGSAEFEERDRVERAVRDLIAVGLLQQVGPLVLPTRAAVVFYRLFED
jgi:hypothetical protein